MAPIDFSMASLVHEHLLQKGVHLYLEKAVASFERTVNGLEVIFKSGERLPADMVLLSIGVRPNTSLATEAGLEIGEMRGIKVNDYLQTSDEHIYAVGDAIEFRHPLTDRPWLNYLAGPATVRRVLWQITWFLEIRLHTKGLSVLPLPKFLI